MGNKNERFQLYPSERCSLPIFYSKRWKTIVLNFQLKPKFEPKHAILKATYWFPIFKIEFQNPNGQTAELNVFVVLLVAVKRKAESIINLNQKIKRAKYNSFDFLSFIQNVDRYANEKSNTKRKQLQWEDSIWNIHPEMPYYNQTEINCIKYYKQIRSDKIYLR